MTNQKKNKLVKLGEQLSFQEFIDKELEVTLTQSQIALLKNEFGIIYISKEREDASIRIN